jgi:hypothetical protein
MLIIEGHRRFVAPRQIHYTWLLFDARRATESLLCKLLGFTSSERVIESEYGCSRALVRHELAPEAVTANRTAARLIDHFMVTTKTSSPRGSNPDFRGIQGIALDARD